MLKRRFANSTEGDFKIKYIDDEIFSGHICCVKVRCEKPLVVNDGSREICIKDDDYTWILLYPSGSNYAITVIFDAGNRLVEWYFDIAKNVGVERGIPYEDDLFLDMVITPEGCELILDEGELQDAKSAGIIDENDVNLAYKTLHYLEGKFANNISGLKLLTNFACEELGLKYLHIK